MSGTDRGVLSAEERTRMEELAAEIQREKEQSKSLEQSLLQRQYELQVTDMRLQKATARPRRFKDAVWHSRFKLRAQHTLSGIRSWCNACTASLSLGLWPARKLP
eukprot:887309-Rhodomonas_salina.1